LGLPLGVDTSEPTLARAVRAEARPQNRLHAGGPQRLPCMTRRSMRPGGRLAVYYLLSGVLPDFGGNCRTPGHMCSAKTNSVTSWRTTALSAYGPRISALCQWVRGRRGWPCGA